MSSLIPERPLLVFPSLAATIGLEESVLLSLLDELTSHIQGEQSRGYLWYELSENELNQHIPFWDALDIQRVSERLRDLGIILLLSAPYGQSNRLKFAFNQQAIEHIKPAPDKPVAPTPKARRTASSGATLLGANWQPDRDTMSMLSQLNIPEHFVRQQLPEFVQYWRERAESHRTWGAKFIQHIKRQWTYHVAKISQARALPDYWQPSAEVQQHIASEGIPATFVQKSLQRFCLYHKNSGTQHANWDTPFFSWLKEDWEQQDTPFMDKKKSTPMTLDWQPDQHTLTYLTTSQGIEQSFIEECIAEFTHKWIEKKAIHSEWGTLFAEHIIEQWRFVQAGVNRNPDPQLITQHWQPSADCVDILTAHSGISSEFITQQIPEFILYWTNRAQPMHSWDNIFLRHVKHQWKQHYERQQANSGASLTKNRSLSDDLNDTSWAKQLSQ